MKIAVTSEGTTPDSAVETRFGRGEYFLLFDSDSNEWEPVTILNEALDASEEAGLQAADTVVKLGAHAVIANHCGTKAFKALEEAGVKIYPASGLTAAEAVKALGSGQLEPFAAADLCSMTEKHDNPPIG